MSVDIRKELWKPQPVILTLQEIRLMKIHKFSAATVGFRV